MHRFAPESLMPVIRHAGPLTRFVVLAAAIGSAAACGAADVTAPDGTARVTLGTPAAAIDTVGGVPRLTFAVDATIHNDGPASIYVPASTCPGPLRVRVGSSWAPAITSEVCILPLLPAIEIAPAGTYTRHVVVAGYFRQMPGAVVPLWVGSSAAGTYRLQFDLTGPEHQLLPEAMSASPPFTISQ